LIEGKKKTLTTKIRMRKETSRTLKAPRKKKRPRLKKKKKRLGERSQGPLETQETPQKRGKKKRGAGEGDEARK